MGEGILIGVCIGIVAMGAAGLILRYIERNDLVKKLDRQIGDLNARSVANDGRAQLWERTARDLFRVLGETRGYLHRSPKTFDDRDRPAIIAQIDAVTFGAEMLLSPPGPSHPARDTLAETIEIFGGPRGGGMSDARIPRALTRAALPRGTGAREPFRERVR